MMPNYSPGGIMSDTLCKGRHQVDGRGIDRVMDVVVLS
jgi:hypothetical protein